MTGRHRARRRSSAQPASPSPSELAKPSDQMESAEPSEPVGPAADPEQDLQARGRLRRYAAAALVLAVVILGVVALWSELRGGSPAPSAPGQSSDCGQPGLVHAPERTLGPATSPQTASVGISGLRSTRPVAGEAAGQLGVVPAGFTAQPVSVSSWLRGGITGSIDGLATSAAKAVVSWLNENVVDAARSMVTGFVHRSTTPRVTAEEFIGAHGAYHDVASFACLGLMGCISLSVITGLFSGEPGQALARLPRDVVVAILSILGFPWAVSKGVEVSDVLATWMLPPSKFRPDDLAGAILPYAVTPGANIGVLILNQFVLFAVMVISLELVVRTALVYVTVALAPLSFMTMTTASGRGAARKAVEMVVAIVMIKPAIFLALRVGVDLAKINGNPSPASGDDWAGILLGLAIAGIAAFMPWIVWRMIPSMEQAVIAQGLSRAPFRAGMQAMQTAYFGSALGSSLSRMGGRGAATPGSSSQTGGGGLGPSRRLATATAGTAGGERPMGGRSTGPAARSGQSSGPRSAAPEGEGVGQGRRSPGSGTRTLVDPSPSPGSSSSGPSPPPRRPRPPRPSRPPGGLS